MSPPLLLDASVWLAAVGDDDLYHHAARELIEAPGRRSAHVCGARSQLYEVASVAVVRWHSPRDAERLVALVTRACADMLERADDELLQQAALLAARHDLTVYDGAYVAAGRRNGWTLVSGDARDLVGPGLAVSPDAATPT